MLCIGFLSPRVILCTSFNRIGEDQNLVLTPKSPALAPVRIELDSDTFCCFSLRMHAQGDGSPGCDSILDLWKSHFPAHQAQEVGRGKSYLRSAGTKQLVKNRIELRPKGDVGHNVAQHNRGDDYFGLVVQDKGLVFRVKNFDQDIGP